MAAKYSAIWGCGYLDSLTLCDCGHVRITVAPEDLRGSAARRAGTAAASGARARCRRRGAELDRGRAYRDQRRAVTPGGGTPGRAGRDARRQLPAAGAGVVVRGSHGRAGRLRPRAGRACPDAGSRPAAAARRVGGGSVLRRTGTGRSAARGSTDPLQRGQAPLGHAGLRGAPPARARPDLGGGAGAALPAPGAAGPGLCTQRRAVAGVSQVPAWDGGQALGCVPCCRSVVSLDPLPQRHREQA